MKNNLRIIIKESNKLDAELSVFVTFNYSNLLVSVMREQKVKVWIPETKEWEVSIDGLETLKRELGREVATMELIGMENIESKGKDIVKMEIELKKSNMVYISRNDMNVFVKFSDTSAADRVKIDRILNNPALEDYSKENGMTSIWEMTVGTYKATIAEFKALGFEVTLTNPTDENKELLEIEEIEIIEEEIIEEEIIEEKVKEIFKNLKEEEVKEIFKNSTHSATLKRILKPNQKMIDVRVGTGILVLCNRRLKVVTKLKKIVTYNPPKDTKKKEEKKEEKKEDILNVNIEIREAKKVNGNKSAFVSFPYDIELINIIRNLSSRYWHAKEKEWEIPSKDLDKFISMLDGRKTNLKDDYTAEIIPPPVEILEGFEFKTKPFNHQSEGFEYGLKYNKFLLADEQGLGKTKQVIDIAIAKKLTEGYKYCLIICGVNGLKWNWQAEIETHSNESSWILGTRYNGKGKCTIGSGKDKLDDLNSQLPDSYFLITNIESLRDKDICTRIKELCDDGTIGMVAIDEIHKCKNPASQQGKAILKLQPETRIAMTGTPLMNTPLDLFIVLKWLGFERHSFYQFKNHYCVMGGYGGYEIVGYKNLTELQSNLDSLMVRRLKKDVLDLPEKIYLTEYVEMNKAQAKIYNDVKADIKERIDKIKMSSNPLAQLIRLRQATGYTGILSSQIKESAKLDRLEELVEELVDNGGKCLIFSNWTKVINPTFKRLKRFNPAIMTGETKDREAQKDMFMNDNNCKCMIGTIGAMGTGLTLTAANTVIFLDSPWNRAGKEQAEDRAHRIGTISTVDIVTLVCKDTIDERIEELIYKKGVMADMLVDGKVDNGRDRAQIIDYLIS